MAPRRAPNNTLSYSCLLAPAALAPDERCGPLLGITYPAAAPAAAAATSWFSHRRRRGNISLGCRNAIADGGHERRSCDGEDLPCCTERGVSDHGQARETACGLRHVKGGEMFSVNESHKQHAPEGCMRAHTSVSFSEVRDAQVYHQRVHASCVSWKEHIQ